MAELQNAVYGLDKLCESKRPKNGLETAMWNNEKLGLSLWIGIVGTGNTKQAQRRRDVGW